MTSEERYFSRRRDLDRAKASGMCPGASWEMVGSVVIRKQDGGRIGS
jgi:hypothetical protein